jgi:hypothetical protein
MQDTSLTLKTLTRRLGIIGQTETEDFGKESFLLPQNERGISQDVASAGYTPLEPSVATGLIS